ncbi:MAG: DUF4364 family protein [Lachnospiraceae bacterium]|nr:DUF4364 family protein [Lachnospiraceae bacterium]
MDFSTSRESLELYKLIVLYMLNRVDFPLTQSQISEFILEQGYTNYLVLQQSLSQLAETGLVQTHSTLNRTVLVITEEGKNTLGYFENQISDAIKQDIHSYFKEHSLKLRDQVSVASNYYKSTSGDYEALLTARDRNTTLVEIRLSVPTAELADSICNNWTKKNQEVYETLTRMLF